MQKIAKFYKISKQQYEADLGFNYDDVTLPLRATAGSAGYDFFAPYDITIEAGCDVAVKSGIRCRIESGYVLFILPKSGLGTKCGIALKNTVGVIDSDYFGADNEGHIIIHLVNNGNQKVQISKGKAYVQGIFLPYGITQDDCTEATRKGGFGSTEKA